MAISIVVPLDGSTVAEGALPVARGLARRVDASVTLVSVRPPPHIHRVIAGIRSPRRLTEYEPYLDRIAGSFPDRQTDQVIRSGDAAAEILDVLVAREAPVVVMATRGRGGVGRFIVGSVTMRVAQRAPCPVIAVKGSPNVGDSGDGSRLDTVLVPLDGSPFAEHILQAIQAVFAPTGPRIHLLRVVELSTYAAGTVGGGFSHQLLETYQHATYGAASRYLERVAGELGDRGHEVTWQVAEGGIPEEIQRVANVQEIDLVAMTTHGRSGLGRFFLGSVAERVLRDSHLPVMLVRPLMG